MELDDLVSKGQMSEEHGSKEISGAFCSQVSIKAAPTRREWHLTEGQ